MTMTYENLGTFAQVAERYHNTKPMRGKNKDKDVRPIADRARDWERVKKISDNCYLLMCGGYADDVFQWYFKKSNLTQAEMVALAPICWRRHKDGTETVTVRNGIGQGAHMNHYSFLDRMLPRSMGFIVQNGKQYVHANSGKHYLPKCMYVPRGIYEQPSDRSRSSWNSWMRATDDGSSLTFFRDGDRFTLASSERDAPKPPRILVNKKQKAKYKDAIASYLAWMSTVAPMLPVDDWQYVNDMRNKVWNARGFESSDGDLAIQIITKQDHPLRIAMAVDFIYSYGIIRRVQSKDDIKEVKMQYNRWINRVCDFTKTVKGK